jgi:hypothetical protein
LEVPDERNSFNRSGRVVGVRAQLGLLHGFDARGVRALGAAAPDRGGRPSGIKIVLELARSVVVGAVIAGVARAGDLHGVGSTVLLGLALWLGFPFVLLTGSIMWEKVPTVTATLHAGDWLLKLVVISVIVGLWL